jgi:hypothetical protein
MNGKEEIVRRAELYAKRNKLVIAEQLGCGVHGTVFVAESQIESGRSAIKIHGQEASYCRERDVYLRLQEHGVTAIRNCEVPRLLHYDDGLWVVRMTVVTRPFVLDFAGAYLDEPPDFPEEVWDEWRERKQEQFGARWPEVEAVLSSLRIYDIHLLDVSPGNVALPE